jgi:hypothetical protein
LLQVVVAVLVQLVEMDHFHRVSSVEPVALERVPTSPVLRLSMLAVEEVEHTLVREERVPVRVLEEMAVAVLPERVRVRVTTQVTLAPLEQMEPAVAVAVARYIQAAPTVLLVAMVDLES